MIRRLLTPLLVLATAAALPAAPAVALPGTTPAEPADAVTVAIDPSYQQPSFQGWGTSLGWFPNITGGYPDEIRDRLVQMVFGEDGLNLNIARYNIGGGNAPDVRKDYMKVGATMAGFWKAPPGTTREDMDWWDPANPDHWNFDADANQRWWIDAIKDKVDHWEAFSNSPPWFQTVSGYVSGGFDSSEDQIRADRVDEFGTYLVRVAEHIEDAHGIEFDTIEPLNEANTPYWGTQLGPDGQPTGGRQEGAHAGPHLQTQVIGGLKRALDRGDTGAVIAAMDETNPGTFATNWNGYGPRTRAAIDQLNVHTYGTSRRTTVRDIAKGADKRLWMSEVEGSFLTGGTSYTSMVPGLGIAERMVSDLRELEPAAWVFWQPVEDTKPQQEAGKNWGSIHIPFDCTAQDTLQTCRIQTNTKYDTIRNFTHYIRPGDRIVAVNDTSSVAAIRPGRDTATLVHVNQSSSQRSLTVDLSRFGSVSSHARVTPIVSSANGGLVRGNPVGVSGKSATVLLPGESVTTLLVEGVSGVAADAPVIRPGKTYRLTGVDSGHSLAPSDDGTGVVIRTSRDGSTEQQWSARRLTMGHSNQERYELVNAGNGRRLAVRDDTAVLESAGSTDPAAQWSLSTTGNGTWTFVNAGTGLLLDVVGAATEDGARVSVYRPTSGSNQLWTVTASDGGGQDDPVTLAARHSGKCASVADGSTANGAGIVQQPCVVGAVGQGWELRDTGDGYVQLVAEHSGKCLDVDGASTADGADLLQWTCHSGANQQWQVRAAGDGYVNLVARHSGKCVDVSGVSTADGALLHQWTCHGGANQEWLRSGG